MFQTSEKSFFKLFMSVFLLAVFTLTQTGCNHYEHTQEVTDAQNLSLDTNQPFLKSLAPLYASFSSRELEDEKDYPDAIHFARKAKDTAADIDVEPEELADWQIEQPHFAELQYQRIRLKQAFFMGAKTSLPDLSARAQFYYDCWVEEQEELGEASYEGECKMQFLSAINQLEQRLRPEPEVTKEDVPLSYNQAGDKKSFYTVFFEFDVAELSEEARSKINRITQDAKQRNVKRVTVRGHTDTSGTPGYNNTLSLNRALAVRQALVDSGLEESKIFIDWEGEFQTMAPTGDEERKRLNRRVDIIF